MSTPTPYDDDDFEPRRGGTSTLMKSVAGVAAAAILAFGASTALSKKSPSSASAAPAAAGYGVPGGGRGPMGTPVTGDTLTKLKAVVTAKYQGASVERANTLPDGSYEVHVIQSGGSEVHVLVSKAFKITGTEQGGPPPGAQAPPGTGTQS